jgi:ELWxxDGT repeat protein
MRAFAARTTASSCGTDGTAEGTSRVKDINPGPDDSLPVRLVAAGDLLFFRATDRFDDTELWRSDGTEAGTVRVRNIRPGVASSFPAGLTARGLVVFAADDGVHGVEPWRSDNEAGTFPLGLLADPTAPSWCRANRIRFAAVIGTRFHRRGRNAWSRSAADGWDGRGTWCATFSSAPVTPRLQQTAGGGRSALLFTFRPTGMELWRATAPARHLQASPGPVSASPHEITAAGDGVSS